MDGAAEGRELRRGELLGRLDRVRPRIAAFIAPAGYGKSTLVRQYLGDGAATCHCAGLRDEADLARRLLAALASADPAREGEMARIQMLLSETTIPAAERFGAVVAAWAAPGVGAMVFENAEGIVASGAAREFFATLLSAMPPDRRAIVCSRENLRLHLTRFAAPHEITVLRASDLAFCADDVATVFAAHDAAPATIDRIVDISQGWPIAVLLIERFAAEGRIGVLDRLGDVAFDQLHDYLLDQVLATLSLPLVDALVACACIPNAAADELRAALADDEAPALLDAFAADSPFVARTPEGSYVVRPLLASLLSSDADRRNALLLKVAMHCERIRDLERAAELYLERNDHAAAANALARHEVALDRSPSIRYAQILASLDRTLVMRYPRLWSISCMLRMFFIDTEDLLDEAESVWRLMDPESGPLERYYVLTLRIALMNYAGHLEDAEAIIDEFVGRVGSQLGGLPAPLSTWIRYQRALIDSRRGRLAAAESELTAALPVVLRTDLMASRTFLALGADIARSRGERALERQYLEHAIEHSRGNPLLTNFHAVELAESAFGAWLAGDEEAFARFAGELDAAVERHGIYGLSYVASVFSGRRTQPSPGESARHVALGRIVAASRCERDDEAMTELRAGLDVAQRYSSPLIEALASVAIALCDAAAFDEHMIAACAAAARCDSTALHESVEAIAVRRVNVGFLAPFVARFSAERRCGAPPLEIEFFSGTVRARGREVHLAVREAELLFAMAAHPHASPRARIAGTVWPELDANAARNAFSVCLHRLRRILGEAAIARADDGYRLCDGSVVDLWESESLLNELRGTARLTDEHRVRLLELASRLAAPRPPRMEEWEWFAETSRRLDAVRVDVAHRLAADALDRNDFRAALAHAEEIVGYDPYDEPARELVIRAYLALGERATAMRQYRQFRAMLAGDLQIEPSPALTRLVYS